MATPTPDQEDAAVALMLDREIDKRVMMAVANIIGHALDAKSKRTQELERRLNLGDMDAASEMFALLLVDLLLREGSLANAIRSKLNNASLQRHFLTHPE